VNRRPENENSSSLEQWTIASTVDLLDVLWRRKWLFALGMFLGVAAGLAYFFLVTPLYESSADVLLVQKHPEAAAQARQVDSGFNDYLNTHRALIVSPMIIERAATTHKLYELETFAGTPNDYPLWEWISEQLYVSGGPRELGDNADSIMKLAFQGTIPEECPIVVEAVLDSYRSFLEEIYDDLSSDSLELIGEARDLLKNELQQQEDEYIEFRKGSPLVARGADEINPLQDRLTSIEAQRSELLIRQAQIEGQLQSLQLALAEPSEPETLLALVTDLRSQNDSENARAAVSNALDNQLVQLADRKLELLDRYGPNHPHVKAIEDRIASTRRMLAAPSSAYIGQESSDASIEGSATEQANTYRQYLEQELVRVNRSAELLSELYDQEHDKAKELSSYQLRDDRYQRNRDRIEQLYSGVISQLKDADMAKGYGGFEARVIDPPVEGERVHPRGRIAVAGGGVLGGLLGLGFALLAELRDKGFRSRVDVQSRLGWPVLAQIPVFGGANLPPKSGVEHAIPLAAALRTYHAPQSAESEAFRRLRTALLFGHRGEVPRVIQVSGPSPDDGASSVAANLAISIAQLDRRVLLIDTDIHRPIQHRLFGIDTERGLSCVMQHRESAEDATYHTAVDNLWLLPAGPNPLANQDAYSADRFAALLREVREQYDMIVIDTEPFLAVSDPCVIASRTDAVLLALRPTKDSRWRSTRAKEMLEAVGVEAWGVVMNNVGGSGAKRYHDASPDYDTAYWHPANPKTRK
jgi:capsular exopolysaccharide synthesis family protein